LYGQDVDFLLVYIAEAHASDVWPLGNHVTIPTHKTEEDRKAAAIFMRDKFGCTLPMLLDTMQDSFDNVFAVWPERYYFIKDGKMEHIGMPTSEFGYDRKSLHWTLRKFAGKLEEENIAGIPEDNV